MTLSKKTKWVAAVAVLTALSWALLYSPWAEWAPQGTKWPSLPIAFLFGLTGFLTLSYYPLMLVASLVSVAFGFSKSGRVTFGDIFFRVGFIFLLGFSSIFALQSMAILRVNAHGAGGSLLLERLIGGLFILAGFASAFLSARKNTTPAWGGIVERVYWATLILFLGLGWGVYYGHEIDPAYDRTFFRIGAGPGSHELPALALFGVGLMGLQAIWTRGAALWMGDVLAQRNIRLGAGAALALLGVLILLGSHPF